MKVIIIVFTLKLHCKKNPPIKSGEMEKVNSFATTNTHNPLNLFTLHVYRVIVSEQAAHHHVKWSAKETHDEEDHEQGTFHECYLLSVTPKFFPVIRHTNAFAFIIAITCHFCPIALICSICSLYYADFPIWSHISGARIQQVFARMRICIHNVARNEKMK